MSPKNTAPPDQPNAQESTEKRLTELEIKASFSEDWLEQLNQTIFRQQEQIDALIREIGQLRRHMPEGSTVTHLRDELPPHY